MLYDQVLLDVANFLKDSGITNNQVTKLHHFSLQGRNETINSTIGFIQKSLGGEVRALTNENYYNRLRFIANELQKHTSTGGVPDTLIDEALRRYPLEHSMEPDVTHGSLYNYLVEQGLEHHTRNPRFCLLFQQKPMWALLYHPEDRYARRGQHVGFQPTRRNFDRDFFAKTEKYVKPAGAEPGNGQFNLYEV